MNDPARDLAEGLRQFAEILGWLLLGALLGGLLASWQAPGSETAMLVSLMLMPGTVVLGWMLMFPLAVLMLPLLIPRFLRWLREPQPPRSLQAPPARPHEATAVGWVFVAAALPTALTAGLVAGAPFTYLLVGLLYGYALRHSAALQRVVPE